MTRSQSKIVDALVEVVARHAPEDWQWAHLEVSMVAELWAGVVTVTAPGKELSGAIQEGQALRLLRELRHRMYVAGSGTWYSMTLDFGPDKVATATYDFEAKPVFDPAPESSVYLRDLQRYRRKDARVPAWLRAMIEEGRGTGDSAADTFTRWLKGGL